jgi:uncharacterized phage-like protein YoqJ
MFTICATGHRPDKLPGGYDIYSAENANLIRKMQEVLLSYYNIHGALHCITGMALGIDQLFAIACIGLKQMYNLNITIEAAVPCIGQESKWPANSQALYNSLLETMDSVYYVTQAPYSAGCMELRNEYMVDNSDLVLAYFDGSKGGTKNCVDYAKEQDKEIINIYMLN